MYKSGKVWGNTELIFRNSAVEMHRISVMPGGECSKHKHNYKWNGFYVEKGCLEILVWQDEYDLVDRTVLRCGDMSLVRPGLYHQFKGCSSDGLATVAFELYFANFQHDDIIRESVGKLVETNTEE
jgi:mannose-6-phosphate isomerase-like protein (cupin superfamily)